jgi:hypothetical protein
MKAHQNTDGDGEAKKRNESLQRMPYALAKVETNCAAVWRACVSALSTISMELAGTD